MYYEESPRFWTRRRVEGLKRGLSLLVAPVVVPARAIVIFVFILMLVAVSKYYDLFPPSSE